MCVGQVCGGLPNLFWGVWEVSSAAGVKGGEAQENVCGQCGGVPWAVQVQRAVAQRQLFNRMRSLSNDVGNLPASFSRRAHVLHPVSHPQFTSAFDAGLTQYPTIFVERAAAVFR